MRSFTPKVDFKEFPTLDTLPHTPRAALAAKPTDDVIG
jgi:hypothetical protein